MEKTYAGGYTIGIGFFTNHTIALICRMYRKRLYAVTFWISFKYAKMLNKNPSNI